MTDSTPQQTQSAAQDRRLPSDFELRVTFTGMCVFVPDKANSQMHVLLPLIKGDRHKAILQVDAAHFATGATKPVGYRMSVDLAKTSLSLPDPAGKSATLKLCPQVVNLYEVTSTPLNPNDSATRKRAIAAFLLGDGKMNAVSSGVCWDWPGATKPRPIANQAQWTMRVTGAALDLKLKDLATGTIDIKPVVPTLHPITPATGTPFIDLFVFHVPPADLPPDPDPPQSIGVGNKPPHFKHFYDLYPGTVSTASPKLKSDSGCTVDEACPEIEPDDRGGSPYTCMVAGVTPP